MKPASRKGPRLPGLPRTDSEAESASGDNATSFADREREARAALGGSVPEPTPSDAPDTVKLSASTWTPPEPMEPDDADANTDVAPGPPAASVLHDGAEVAGVIGGESEPVAIVDRPPPAAPPARPEPAAEPIPGISSASLAAAPPAATPAPAFSAAAPSPPEAVPAPVLPEPTLLVRPKRRRNPAVLAITAAISALVGLGAGYLVWGRRSAPTAAPPAASSPVAAVAAKVPACRLAVETDPRGATVTRDGKKLGETPLDTEVPCGEARLSIEHDRYARVEKTVTLAPEEPGHLELDLVRPTHRLKIRSRPPGARVWVRGKPEGTTPVTVEVPGFEKSKVVIKKRGYRPFVRRIYSDKDEMRLRPRLRKRR